MPPPRTYTKGEVGEREGVEEEDESEKRGLGREER